MLSRSIARERTFIDRRRKYRPHTDQVGIGGLAGLFSPVMVTAVGAVGILASFTDGLSSCSVYPSAGGDTSMHLANDYIHPTSRGGRCRIRICLPEEEQDSPVVICSELPNNGGTSVTYAAEQLAAEVIRSHRLPTALVWIEHWPEESTDGGEGTFELGIFSSYEVAGRAPYLGKTRLTIGEPTWKALERETVEALVGQHVGMGSGGVER